MFHRLDSRNSSQSDCQGSVSVELLHTYNSHYRPRTLPYSGSATGPLRWPPLTTSLSSSPPQDSIRELFPSYHLIDVTNELNCPRGSYGIVASLLSWSGLGLISLLIVLLLVNIHPIGAIL